MGKCKTCKGKGFIGLGNQPNRGRGGNKGKPCPDCKTPDRRRSLLETTDWFKDKFKEDILDLKYNNEHQGDVAESYAQFWFQQKGCTVGIEKGKHDYDMIVTFPNGERVFCDVKYLGVPTNKERRGSSRSLTEKQKKLGVKLVYVSSDFSSITMPESYCECGLDYSASVKNRTGSHQPQSVISEVKKLFKKGKGWSAYAIAKKLKLHRGTIKKILEEAGLNPVADHVKRGKVKYPFGQGKRTMTHEQRKQYESVLGKNGVWYTKKKTNKGGINRNGKAKIHKII